MTVISGAFLNGLDDILEWLKNKIVEWSEKQIC
jgi:hypothetical protein